MKETNYKNKENEMTTLTEFVSLLVDRIHCRLQAILR